MQKEVVRLLIDWGFTIQSKKITTDDLYACRMVITNSLMGVVPVLSLDGKNLPAPDDLWKKINKKVLK